MSTITATAATFTRLRNGSWGVKGAGLKAGATVTVTKRDGSTSTVTIDRIIWTGSGIQIASVTSNRPAPRATNSWSVRRPVVGGHCQMCGNQAWDCDC